MQASVAAALTVFDEIDEGGVDHLVAARGGVVARKIPVAIIFGASLVEVFDRLVEDFHFSLASFGGDHTGDLV